MTATAIVFLVLSALLIWGGLVVSVVLLRRDGRLVAELDAIDHEQAAARAPGDGRSG